MITFKQLQESISAHKSRVSKFAKDSVVSFTDDVSGKKVTGTYQGIKNHGGKSYASISSSAGKHWVPLHQVMQESTLDEMRAEEPSQEEWERLSKDHNDTADQFYKHIEKVDDKKTRREMAMEFGVHSDAFCDGGEYDRKDPPEHHLDQMKNILDKVKKHANV